MNIFRIFVYKILMNEKKKYFKNNKNLEECKSRLYQQINLEIFLLWLFFDNFLIAPEGI